RSGRAPRSATGWPHERHERSDDMKAGGVGRIFRPTYPPPGMSYKAAKAAGVLRQVKIWRISFACRRLCGDPQCGGRHSESTGSESRRDAEKLLQKKLGQLGLGKLVTRDIERTSFEDLAKMLVADYEANGRKSLTRAQISIAHLREAFGHSRALAITT